MGLPWVRLDSNINQHDKILDLLAERDGYRAFTLYICGLGWSGGAGTDGHIPRSALPILHGQERHARMLVDHGLWSENGTGWQIHNWAERQELSLVTDLKSEARHRSALKANCIRHHGPKCGCWEVAP